ncbi:MAG: N-acetyl-D-Glu racemase DgcA [Paracoccaceae bacterium]
MKPRLVQLGYARLPLKKPFVISRGTRLAAELVTVTLHDGTHYGRGECQPFARFGESCDGVINQIESAVLAEFPSAGDLQALPPGAARNALDCARWDLRAKQTGQPVWQLAGLAPPQPVTTALTISLDTPAAMHRAAVAARARPVLKVKLGGVGDLDRLAAVHKGAPNTRLVVDANEGWTLDDYLALAPQFAQLGVAMIEQPLLAVEQEALRGQPRPVPLCADESCVDRASLPSLAGLYDLVNIKLDKCGGLTEALALRSAARAQGFGIMVGCMLSSSLSIAPAQLVAQGAEFVDLDGPLWLRADRFNGLKYEDAQVHPAAPGLWG